MKVDLLNESWDLYMNWYIANNSSFIKILVKVNKTFDDLKIYFIFEIVFYKRLMDNTPTKSNTSQNETCGDSLYEIPQCTICLQ